MALAIFVLLFVSIGRPPLLEHRGAFSLPCSPSAGRSAWPAGTGFKILTVHVPTAYISTVFTAFALAKDLLILNPIL